MAVIRVLVSAGSSDKEFDYLLGSQDIESVAIGTIVRVPLAGRKVEGWVCDIDPPIEPGISYKEICSLQSAGPDPSIMELSKWAAYYWLAPRSKFLKTASPDRRIPLGRTSDRNSRAETSNLSARDGFEKKVLLAHPRQDIFEHLSGLIHKVIESGKSVLVLAPTIRESTSIAMRLTSNRFKVAQMPRGWQQAYLGEADIIVGSRSGAWAPAPRLGLILVIECQDEAYREERFPYWNAIEVCEERARRAGIPVYLLSSFPSVDHMREIQVDRLPDTSRTTAGAKWSTIEIIDMRFEDPKSGIYSEKLLGELRHLKTNPNRKIVIIYNRKGRSKLQLCNRCKSIVCCEICSSMLVLTEDCLMCPRCANSTPIMCTRCGSGSIKLLRQGVTRLASELATMLGIDVLEISSSGTNAHLVDGSIHKSDSVHGSRSSGRHNRVEGYIPAFESDLAQNDKFQLYLGTEVVLSSIGNADKVVFLELEQELFGRDLGSVTRAMSLIAKAMRLSSSARVLVQTRYPDHPALKAVLDGTVESFLDQELILRRELKLPPFWTRARIEGPGCDQLISRIGKETDWALTRKDVETWFAMGQSRNDMCELFSQYLGYKGIKVSFENTYEN